MKLYLSNARRATTIDACTRCKVWCKAARHAE